MILIDRVPFKDVALDTIFLIILSRRNHLVFCKNLFPTSTAQKSWSWRTNKQSAASGMQGSSSPVHCANICSTLLCGVGKRKNPPVFQTATVNS
jgi:hypothetical protein